MSTGFSATSQKIKYEGPDSTNPLAFRHYNPDEIVMGKRMEDHLRFAVAYWHSFAWPGGDPFGGQHLRASLVRRRRWTRRKLKADVAFEFFQLLGAPYYCFHDADVRPEGANFAENTQEPRTRSSTTSPRSRPRPASSCCGARPTCSPTAASCRAPRPIPIRMCSPIRRRDGQDLHGRDA